MRSPGPGNISQLTAAEYVIRPVVAARRNKVERTSGLIETSGGLGSSFGDGLGLSRARNRAGRVGRVNSINQVERLCEAIAVFDRYELHGDGKASLHVRREPCFLNDAERIRVYQLITERLIGKFFFELRFDVAAFAADPVKKLKWILDGRVLDGVLIRLKVRACPAGQ